MNNEHQINISLVAENLLQDQRLHSSHISLFFALFLLWQQNLYKNPINVTRARLMGISKIGSKATYHKCIKQLNAFGYINYLPTYNSFIGTTVEIKLLFT
jgi:hypothetical protein